MQQTIFVSATNTHIGKTHITTLLIEAYSKKGYKVGVFKPIETGVSADGPQDAQKLFETAKMYNPALEVLTLETICPYTFGLPAAPFVAKGHEIIEMEVIVQSLERIKALCDIVLIEGAGGLMVPIEKDFFMVDLARLIADKLLLVVPSRLGSINDTLLSLHLLKASQMPVIWAVNLYEDAQRFQTVTAPFYEAVFDYYYVLPQDLSLVAEALLS